MLWLIPATMTIVATRIIAAAAFHVNRYLRLSFAQSNAVRSLSVGIPERVLPET